MGQVKAMRYLLPVLLMTIGAPALAQRLVEWTEGPGELSLGYPVPIPVDTPLPFAGFRSYDALHLRHQDLMMSRSELDGEVIGQTAQGRDIWAYRLSDPDAITRTGLPEPAMMIQGTIHAREWQAPETVTGLMEWILNRRNDRYLHQYLLENTNIVAIPVLNVDGFLQTQRFPRRNYLGSDPGSPSFAPRDGRMRRKHMLGVDEDLSTVDDHLLGVDLNRNNPPFWNTSSRSSSDTRSLVYHGPSPHSEPETQAMVDAVNLAPAGRLRVYTDVHSFSQVFFSERTSNLRRNSIQTGLLSDFAEFHARLPGSKRYLDIGSASGSGIGSTDEYFAQTYQIPSWTLEIEPSDGSIHANLPGEGADYGGTNSNGHDGFILPESEIQRVRRNLAQSFVVAYYHQAGPPSVAALRFIDTESGAVVYDAEWDVVSAGARALHRNVIQPLELGREYLMWLAFDKPMRWREDGDVVPLPGQTLFGQQVTADLFEGDTMIPADVVDERWLDGPGGSPGGFLRYQDDTVIRRLTLSAGDSGIGSGITEAMAEIRTQDMVGLTTDADPSTPIDWADGHWVGYEDSNLDETDFGGFDRTLSVPVTASGQLPPFLVEAGNTAAYFDPTHDGEGFLLEILEDQRAVVYWFTYDETGAQRWFTATGEIRGNEIVFEELLVTRGGLFGPDFDPDAVKRIAAGRLSILFSGCDEAGMRYETVGKTFRQSLTRLTLAAGLDCQATTRAGSRGAVAVGGKGLTDQITGSWFDPSHAGEGFVVEALNDSRVVIYWFSYDPEGNQAWFVGSGVIDEDGMLTIDETLVTRGGIFGDDFDPADVERSQWGTMSFDFDCESATMSYDSSVAGFGSGSQNLIRLTRPRNIGECG